ncbi:glycosyltransferase family 4 protein [Myroides sp.]|uniref:glycosyltransferase family 4 protein n=1 Tax=Myroides sp. TaxID=1874736 RepID=UPI0028A96446|nr:glycosyltransferase family 4 protein [Myroides sp.]
MKLVYLHQYFKFPNENGGTRSYDLAKRFIKKGIKVIILTTSSDIKYSGKRWTEIMQDGIEVHYLYLPYDNSFGIVKRISAFMKFLILSFFHLSKIKCDLVLATSTPLTIGIPALLKKWKDNTPFIFETRDVWPEAVVAIGAIRNKIVIKLLYKLEYIIYKNANAIVPLSVDMQASIIKRYPQFRSKTNVVVENISEIDRFNYDDSTVDFKKVLGVTPRFSVLYAGTFGQVNGIHKVVELAEFTYKIDPSVVFILIGSGAKKLEIIELAKEKKVYNKNVFIKEPISKCELPLWYNSVSMGSSFVVDIKELWVNSANKFFDTLAAARPILINHEGWQADIIRKENIGYVLPVNIDYEVAKEFVNYTRDIDLNLNQGNKAFQLANEYYSLDVASEKYLNLINDIS